MSKRKFILLSILKTWLLSTILTVIFLIIFLSLTKEVRETPRYCDMSGLVYGFAILGLLSLSILSFCSLFSILKSFQGKMKVLLTWFLVPFIVSLYSFLIIMDGEVSGEGIFIFLIMALPWWALWIYHYNRYIVLYNEINH
ncbi:hypothetical protein F3J23_15830 [Chryseobacterium sp. Tr-659]|uniref:hypothetical protein n=1 Tax=Chryseobacterium sp. Tr-659 TaxID=2608340 RepID=UPI00141E9EC9|nr:hypothetical protein [Chryseobacterium sp. Tr-659]NIF06916.1 hypothetical protein [Chryseobacterium sp. Tr-659]